MTFCVKKLQLWLEENTVKMEAHLWVNPVGNLDVKAKSDSIIRIKAALQQNNVSIPRTRNKQHRFFKLEHN